MNIRQERIIIGRELLVTQMNHWALFPAAVTLVHLINGGKPQLLLWVVCSLLPFCLFLVRRYTDQFLLFLVSHVGLAAGMFLTPCESLPEKVILIFLTAGYLMYSFYLRVQGGGRLDSPVHPGFAVGVGAFSLLMQRYQGNGQMDAYYVIPLIAVLGMYFLQYYMERYLYFLTVNESSAGHIPQREIFTSGMGLAALYTGAGMIFLLITSNVGWLTAVMAQVLKALRWLAGLLPATEPEESSTIETAGEQGIMGMSLPEPGETALFWIILEKILIITFFCLAFAALLWMSVKMFRYLYDRFGMKKAVKKEVLESVMDVREKCGIDREKEKSKALFSFLDPAQRIRRIYKKRIWAERYRLTEPGNESRLENFTARECGNRLEEEALCSLYEKARYSRDECTSWDVKEARGKVWKK